MSQRQNRHATKRMSLQAGSQMDLGTTKRAWDRLRPATHAYINLVQVLDTFGVLAGRTECPRLPSNKVPISIDSQPLLALGASVHCCRTHPAVTDGA